MIAAEEFDLVLLDIMMPELDGYPCSSAFARTDPRSSPVIMISAVTEIESVVRCIEIGATDYLPSRQHGSPAGAGRGDARESACGTGSGSGEEPGARARDRREIQQAS